MLSVATQYTGAQRLGSKQRGPALTAQFAPAEIPAFDRPLGHFNVGEKIGVSELAVTSANANLRTLDGLAGKQTTRAQFNFEPPSVSRQIAGGVFGFTVSMALSAINPLAGIALEATNLIQDTRNFVRPPPRSQPYEEGLAEFADNTVRDRNTSQLQHHLNALVLLRTVQARSNVTYDAVPDRPLLPAPAFIL